MLNRLGTGMMVLRRDLSSMEVELDIEGLSRTFCCDLIYFFTWFGSLNSETIMRIGKLMKICFTCSMNKICMINEIQ